MTYKEAIEGSRKRSRFMEYQKSKADTNYRVEHIEKRNTVRDYSDDPFQVTIPANTVFNLSDFIELTLPDGADLNINLPFKKAVPKAEVESYVQNLFNQGNVADGLIKIHRKQ